MNIIRYNKIIAGKAKARIKRKLESRGGFSLAETLLAVLILLLVSVVVATGMPAATNAYNKVILGANAKVMLSTAITALHDELGTAWGVDSSNTTSLTYFNASTGAKSEISLDNGKAIQIQDYLTLSDDLIHAEAAKTGSVYHLVSDSKSGMYVTYSSISYADGIVTITGLKVCKQTDDVELAQFVGEDGSATPFKIRVISKDSK